MNYQSLRLEESSLWACMAIRYELLKVTVQVRSEKQFENEFGQDQAFTTDTYRREVLYNKVLYSTVLQCKRKLAVLYINNNKWFIHQIR